MREPFERFAGASLVPTEYKPLERDPDRVIGSTEIPPPHDAGDVDVLATQRVADNIARVR